MAVNLQAEAIITAKDETGAVIEGVTGKLKKLGAAVRAVGSAPVQALQASARAADRADHVVNKVGRAIVGTYIASKVTEVGAGVIDSYAKLDDLLRYQRAVMQISEQQQQPMLKQAMELGASTPYDALQVAEAQLALAQRGIKEDLILPIVKSATEYAQAMSVELPQAAQTVEGLLFSTGQVVTDGTAALAAAKRAVDQMAKAAKISGMSDEDLREGIKFSGLAGSTAGLSNATILASLALQKRANIPGSEAGVAIRALAGRLVAPTKEGLDALAAMGIDYNKYTSLGGGLSAGNLNEFMAQRFGHHLSNKGIANVARIFGDPEILGDRDKFVSAMFDALRPGFGKGRGRKMRPQDARELTKAISDYYKNSVEHVQSEALLHAIMAAHPTIGQLNEIFGQKQGARIMAIMRDQERFEQYEHAIAEAPEGFAESIAEERQGGFAGAKKRAEGGAKNVELSLGLAWDDQLKAAAKALAKVEQAFVGLDKETQREISATVATTAAVAGVGAVLKTFELGLSGTAAALLGIPRALASLAARAITSAAGRVLGPLGVLLESTEPANAGEKPFGKDWLTGAGPSNWTPQHFTIGDVRMRLGLPVVPPAAISDGPARVGSPAAAAGTPAWPPEFSVPAALSGVGGHAIAAEVKGSADLNVNVQVEPSDSFISRIVTAIENRINAFGGGAPGRAIGSDASTGLSMPEAVPPY